MIVYGYQYMYKNIKNNEQMNKKYNLKDKMYSDTFNQKKKNVFYLIFLPLWLGSGNLIFYNLDINLNESVFNKRFFLNNET